MSDGKDAPAGLKISEEGGVRFLEGPPDQRVFSNTEDATLVVEACLNGKAKAALLYAANLTAGFFDLSSGEAGAILQKLRNYRIRLAIVYDSKTIRLSSRFNEMAAEERRGGQFALFDSAAGARAWVALADHRQPGT